MLELSAPIRSWPFQYHSHVSASSVVLSVPPFTSISGLGRGQASTMRYTRWSVRLARKSSPSAAALMSENPNSPVSNPTESTHIPRLSVLVSRSRPWQ